MPSLWTLVVLLIVGIAWALYRFGRRLDGELLAQGQVLEGELGDGRRRGTGGAGAGGVGL